MVIKCICIDDKNRPSKIPLTKWVKKGKEYSVVYTLMIKPQNTLGVQLAQIDLDETCRPYTFFLANRFAFKNEDIMKLIDFIAECTEIEISVKDLLKQTQTQKI